MKITYSVIQNTDEYRDVDVHIVEPSGEEWLFRIFKDKETDTISPFSAPRYSPAWDKEFDDGGKEPPHAVVQCLMEHAASIVELVEKDMEAV